MKSMCLLAICLIMILPYLAFGQELVETPLIIEKKNKTIQENGSNYRSNCSSLTISDYVIDNICSGESDGVISITNVTGGIAPYTYSWSGGQTTSTLTNLAAGTYTVTITDDIGCDTNLTYTVAEPPVGLSAVLMITDGYCSDNGWATVLATGGTLPYTYSWSTGETTTSVNNLPSGLVSVTVTDAAGCFETENGNVSNASGPLIALNSSTSPSCNGGNDGTIDVLTIGGVSPYVYSWDTGETTEDLGASAAGSHTLTVTDGNGCYTTFSHTLYEPSTLNAILNVTDGYCSDNGWATVVASGGTFPYIYSWSTGETTSSINNLSSGAVSVTVTDNAGCFTTKSGTVSNPNGLQTALRGSTNVSCYGGNDGTINAGVAGGVFPYTYSWSNGETTEDLTAGTAGTHTLTITDFYGCFTTFSHTLTQPSAIAVTGTTSPIVNGFDGAIDLTVSGGTPPYSYSWSNGQTTQDLNGLSISGSYTCTITDYNACVTSITLTVTGRGRGRGSVDETNTSLKNEDISLYPNPTSGFIMVEFQNNNNADIQVFNTAGELVYMDISNGNKYVEMDLRKLNPGVYFVKVTGEDGIENMEKFVVMH